MTDPNLEEIWQSAVARHQAGDLPAAEAGYRQILARQPQHPGALHLFGVLAHQVGQHGTAVQLISASLQSRPDNPNALNDLGQAQLVLDQISEAVACWRRALELDPRHPPAAHNLADVLADQGDFAAAVPLYHLALPLGLPRTPFALGTVLLRLSRPAEATEVLREAVRRDASSADAHANLALSYVMLGQSDPAESHARTAISLNPSSAPAHSMLGDALRLQSRFVDAAEAYRRATELDPASADLQVNLASISVSVGEIATALAAYRASLALREDPMVRSAYLLALHYDTTTRPEALVTEHGEWARRHGSPAEVRGPVYSHGKIRLGYVSADFRLHPVADFIEPVLVHHDRGAFDVYCYADESHADARTAQLKRIPGVSWRTITGVSDDALFELIRRDEIDVLVDLAGHTSGHRLGVFARRPAAVQVTYLGYPDTTGVAAIDYRITDSMADPEGVTDAYHVEKLLRLDGCAWCYRPPVVCRKFVGPRPLTFGSFNALPKLNGRVLETWGQLLREVPGTRLLIKSRGLEDLRVRGRIAAHFVGLEDRVTLVGPTPLQVDHLAAYAGVDVALDPFPYNGTTTTCEALHMGVPVVCLAGRTHVGRVGVSLLTAAGLPELVAGAEDEYVAIAKQLADDPGWLGEVRGRLVGGWRGDEVGFTRELEGAYRRAWERRRK